MVVSLGLLLLFTAPGLCGQGSYGKLRELPVTSITPEGWLRELLLKQRSGLTGNLDRTMEPAPNGFLGPRHLGKMRWPHAVFFQSLMLQYAATADERIPRALEKHYLADNAPFDLERTVANHPW